MDRFNIGSAAKKALCGLWVAVSLAACAPGPTLPPGQALDLRLSTSRLTLLPGQPASVTLDVVCATIRIVEVVITPEHVGRMAGLPARVNVDCNSPVGSSSGPFTGNLPVNFSASNTAPAGPTSIRFSARDGNDPPVDRMLDIDVGTLQRLDVTLASGGRITSAPAGIDCGSDCTEAYASGTTVTLTAAADIGQRFVAWGGACSGSNASVSVVMTGDATCSASFVAIAPPPPPAIGWNGTALHGGNSAQAVALAVDRGGAAGPVSYTASAYGGAGGRSELVMQRHDGSTTTQLGSGSINDGPLPSTQALAPAMALLGGAPAVAWADNGQRLRVKLWNGTAWSVLSDNLATDATHGVEGAQAHAAAGELWVAWIETDAARLNTFVAFKRWSVATQQWSGGLITGAPAGATAIRLASDGSGAPLLMVVSYAPTEAAQEALSVLRPTAGSATWGPACAAAPAVPPAAALTLHPNRTFGFGVGISSYSGEVVVAHNNGEAVYVQACSGGRWLGIGGVNDGQLSGGPGRGELLSSLAMGRAPDGGFAVVRSKLIPNGSLFNLEARVVVELGAGALGEPVGQLVLANDSGLAARSLALDFATRDTPRVATLASDTTGGREARLFTYVMP